MLLDLVVRFFYALAKNAIGPQRTLPCRPGVTRFNFCLANDLRQSAADKSAIGIRFAPSHDAVNVSGLAEKSLGQTPE
jgi:hypothetical protein